MMEFGEENDGIKFVLLDIDILSKYLWMRPLKDKKGSTVARAFKDILREGKQPTKSLHGQSIGISINKFQWCINGS
jgi:hypothetical protein